MVARCGIEVALVSLTLATYSPRYLRRNFSLFVYSATTTHFRRVYLNSLFLWVLCGTNRFGYPNSARVSIHDSGSMRDFDTS
jgi:hypothetical protein